MKHVYPPRHPASFDTPPADATAASREPQPALPPGHDEPSESRASTTPQQEEMGRKAYGNAVDGTADTDRGPVMDHVYNDKVAPRVPSEPRR